MIEDEETTTMTATLHQVLTWKVMGTVARRLSFGRVATRQTKKRAPIAPAGSTNESVINADESQ